MKQFLYIIIVFFFSYFSFSQSSVINQEKFTDKYREFDFWIGEWDVNLRKPNDKFEYIDWKESKAKIYSILDGRGVLELWEEESNGSPSSTIIGYSLRYYNPDKNKWELWLNWPGINRSGSQQFNGKFRHGRGEFFRQTPINDSIVNITRYTFSDITPKSLRWDGASSTDKGKTWASGWIMEFSRIKDRAEWSKSDKLHTFRNGDRCNLKEFGSLEKFVGKWKGQVKIKNKNGEWKNKSIFISIYKTLGGCAIMSFLDLENKTGSRFKEFGLLTYNTYVNKFEDGRLSNDPKSIYRSFFGDMKDGSLELNHRNRTTSDIMEKYKWKIRNNKLSIEKWKLKNGEMTKVLDGVLNIE